MRLTLAQLLTLSDTSAEGLKGLRRRDQLALAFGQRFAYQSLTFFPIDAVGMRLAAGLGNYLGLLKAAQVVRLWSDDWLRVVAEVEHSGVLVEWCVVELVDALGKKATWTSTARSPDGTSAPNFAEVKGRIAQFSETSEFAKMCAAAGLGPGARPQALLCVPVKPILATIRQRAAKEGLDLSGPFMPAPGPALDVLLKPYVEARDRAVREVASLTKRGREKLAEQAGQASRQLAEAMLAIDGGSA